MSQFSGAVRYCVVNNQVIPDEGPKALPLVLDFSTGDPIELDLSLFAQQGRFSMLQTIFVDASNSANDIAITVDGTGQRVVAKTKTQGYYTILAQNPIRLKFESLNGGTDNVAVVLLNVPIAGVVWDVS